MSQEVVGNEEGSQSDQRKSRNMILDTRMQVEEGRRTHCVAGKKN